MVSAKSLRTGHFECVANIVYNLWPSPNQLPLNVASIVDRYPFRKFEGGLQLVPELEDNTYS